MAGRKSKLSPEQWEDAAKRLASGEHPTVIAAGYGVNEATIRKGIEKHKPLAARIAAHSVETAQISAQYSNLPNPEKRIVQGLAAELCDISANLAGAAAWGAKTARRMSWLANTQAERIADVDPLSLESQPALAGVALLTKLANSSAEIGLNLLRANKETVDDLNKAAEDPPVPTQIVFRVADGTVEA